MIYEMKIVLIRWFALLSSHDLFRFSRNSQKTEESNGKKNQKESEKKVSQEKMTTEPSEKKGRTNPRGPRHSRKLTSQKTFSHSSLPQLFLLRVVELDPRGRQDDPWAGLFRPEFESNPSGDSSTIVLPDPPSAGSNPHCSPIPDCCPPVPPSDWRGHRTRSDRRNDAKKEIYE